MRISGKSHAMQLFLFIICFHLSITQTIDYNINNQQICTHKPFKVNFQHNCSRTRLIEDVSISNNDQILYISIIQNITLNFHTKLTIIKSSIYNQQIFLTFLSNVSQYISINNIQYSIQNFTINSYLYDTLSDQSMQTYQPIPIPISYLKTDPCCVLKNGQLLPPSYITRIYYLYTTETNLTLDLTMSTNSISPLLTCFETCFAITTKLTALAIALIVIVAVLGSIALVLIIICLRKQLYELFGLVKNYLNFKRPSPVVVIDGEPSS